MAPNRVRKGTKVFQSPSHRSISRAVYRSSLNQVVSDNDFNFLPIVAKSTIMLVTVWYLGIGRLPSNPTSLSLSLSPVGRTLLLHAMPLPGGSG
ncbi:MAG TPA: hypothetical protein VHO90_13690 [Bacteroidales bacterium]|nr:hypothetical protein [Bacteroidales bacterium]